LIYFLGFGVFEGFDHTNIRWRDVLSVKHSNCTTLCFVSTWLIYPDS
jgi:hypothetical protein